MPSLFTKLMLCSNQIIYPDHIRNTDVTTDKLTFTSKYVIFLSQENLSQVVYIILLHVTLTLNSYNDKLYLYCYQTVRRSYVYNYSKLNLD